MTVVHATAPAVARSAVLADATDLVNGFASAVALAAAVGQMLEPEPECQREVVCRPDLDSWPESDFAAVDRLAVVADVADLVDGLAPAVALAVALAVAAAVAVDQTAASASEPEP